MVLIVQIEGDEFKTTNPELIHQINKLSKICS